MPTYLEIFFDSLDGYSRFLIQDIQAPNWHSFFYWLVGLSFFFWALELVMPWRRKQGAIRKDFWLDGFYMFFNVFILALIGYHALSMVVVELFRDGLRELFGIENMVAVAVDSWPVWLHVLVLFVLRDFIQWNVHRLLHRSSTLWQFHKVHHSVEQLGFAAHLRFHWMEVVVYRTLEYVPLAMLGFGIDAYFAVHIVTLGMGHFNHTNIRVPLGPLKYILNNPQMHLWHHVKVLPADRKYGVNYGLTLSVWDYLFGTAYVPKNGAEEPCGFSDMDTFPKSFLGQIVYPFIRPKAERRRRRRERDEKSN